MLIAISGSQGAGKSTIIRELEKYGFNSVQRKTSRSVLNDWNVTLDEVNTNYDLSVKFQDELMERKDQDELEAVKSNDIWFCERTFADLFVYTLINLGKLNEYSDWVDDYYEQCKAYSQKYIAVFYIRGGLFNVEHDGIRGSNKHYSRMVDVSLLDFTQQMIEPRKLLIISEPDLDKRVKKVIDTASYIKLQMKDKL